MMRKQGVRSNLRLSLRSFVISIGRLSLILYLVECTHKQTFLPDKIFMSYYAVLLELTVTRVR